MRSLLRDAGLRVGTRERARVFEFDYSFTRVAVRPEAIATLRQRFADYGPQLDRLLAADPTGRRFTIEAPDEQGRKRKRQVRAGDPGAQQDGGWWYVPQPAAAEASYVPWAIGQVAKGADVEDLVDLTTRFHELKRRGKITEKNIQAFPTVDALRKALDDSEGLTAIRDGLQRFIGATSQDDDKLMALGAQGVRSGASARDVLLELRRVWNYLDLDKVAATTPYPDLQAATKSIADKLAEKAKTKAYVAKTEDAAPERDDFIVEPDPTKEGTFRVIRFFRAGDGEIVLHSGVASREKALEEAHDSRSHIAPKGRILERDTPGGTTRISNSSIVKTPILPGDATLFADPTDKKYYYKIDRGPDKPVDIGGGEGELEAAQEAAIAAGAKRLFIENGPMSPPRLYRGSPVYMDPAAGGGPEWKITRLDNRAAVQLHGGDATWCVAGADPSYYKSYSKRGDFFLFERVKPTGGDSDKQLLTVKRDLIGGRSIVEATDQNNHSTAKSDRQVFSQLLAAEGKSPEVRAMERVLLSMGASEAKAEHDAPEWLGLGFDATSVAEWFPTKLGPDASHAWREAGLTAPEALAWTNPTESWAVEKPKIVLAWKAEGFDAETSAPWRKMGFDKPKQASGWAKINVSPENAYTMQARGLTPRSAGKWIKAFGSDAAAWYRLAPEFADAKALAGQGLDGQFAEDFVNAAQVPITGLGEDDVAKLVEFQEAGYSPSTVGSFWTAIKDPAGWEPPFDPASLQGIDVPEGKAYNLKQWDMRPEEKVETLRTPHDLLWKVHDYADKYNQQNKDGAKADLRELTRALAPANFDAKTLDNLLEPTLNGPEFVKAVGREPALAQSMARLRIMLRDSEDSAASRDANIVQMALWGGGSVLAGYAQAKAFSAWPRAETGSALVDVLPSRALDPVELAPWFEDGKPKIHDGGVAQRTYLDAGIPPEAALELNQYLRPAYGNNGDAYNLTSDQLRAWAAPDILAALKHDPTKLVDRNWAMLEPHEALAWRRLLPNTPRLSDDVFKEVEEAKARGLTPEAYAPYAKAGYKPLLAGRMFADGVTPEDGEVAARVIERRKNAPDGGGHQSYIGTQKQVAEYRLAGVPLDQAADWIVGDVPVEVAKAWAAHGFTAEQYKSYQSAHPDWTPEHAVERRQRRLDRAPPDHPNPSQRQLDFERTERERQERVAPPAEDEAEASSEGTTREGARERPAPRAMDMVLEQERVDEERKQQERDELRAKKRRLERMRSIPPPPTEVVRDPLVTRAFARAGLRDLEELLEGAPGTLDLTPRTAGQDGVAGRYALSFVGPEGTSIEWHGALSTAEHGTVVAALALRARGAALWGPPVVDARGSGRLLLLGLDPGGQSARRGLLGRRAAAHEAFERAMDALWAPARNWVFYGAADAKTELFAAWNALDVEAKNALAAAIAGVMRGEQTVYRRSKGEAALGGMSMSTDRPVAGTFQAYVVQPHDVLLHWALPDSPLASNAFGHEHELILRPDAQPVPVAQPAQLRDEAEE